MIAIFFCKVGKRNFSFGAVICGADGLSERAVATDVDSDGFRQKIHLLVGCQIVDRKLVFVDACHCRKCASVDSVGDIKSVHFRVINLKGQTTGAAANASDDRRIECREDLYENGFRRGRAIGGSVEQIG